MQLDCPITRPTIFINSNLDKMSLEELQELLKQNKKNNFKQNYLN